MNDEKYKAAKKRVAEIRDFYKNLITYAVVNVFLIIINLLTSPESIWFYWVTIFWGLGLLFHASKVFLFKDKYLGKQWEEKQINKILSQDKDSEEK